MPFAKNGFIEITTTNVNGCTINMHWKSTKAAAIRIIDENEAVIYSSAVISRTATHIVNYNFKKVINFEKY